jgi:hypothetical protein
MNWRIAALVCSLVPCQAAFAQNISPQDLQGWTMSVTVNYAGTFDRQGLVYDANIVRRLTVSFGTNGAIRSRAVREVHHKGTVTTLVRSFVGTFNKPGANDAKDAQVLWTINADELVALNVFGVGGRATRYKLTRSNSGFTCTANAKFMQEVGAGTTTTTAGKGGSVKILKIRQTGSSCNFSRG